MKKVLRMVFAIAMVAVLSLSMFACTEQEETKEEKIFAKQYKNDRYYFQQGYPDDWSYAHGEGGTEFRELEMVSGTHSGVLCTKFTSKDADQVYTVYKYNTNSVTTTLESFMANAMETIDPSKGQSLYPFNEVFTETDEVRDTYVLTSAEATSVNYRQKSWSKAEFTFVKDTEDWKGAYYVAISPQAGEFMVVVWEAKADVWDAAIENFEKMMKDFAFISMGTTEA